MIPVFLTFKPHSQNTHITVTSNHYSYPLFLQHVNYASTTVRSSLFPPDWDGSVSKNRTGPLCGPVPIFLRTIHSPVSNIKTGPYDSPDWTGPWDRTSVWSQNLGPDCLQISPVQSGPSLTVWSGQSTCTSFWNVPHRLLKPCQVAKLSGY